MCRSIIRLREGAEIHDREAMEKAARQFVRKVSGFSRPASHNQEVFEQAVNDITDSVARLMAGLQVRGSR